MTTGFPCAYKDCTLQVEASGHPCEYCPHHCPRGSWFRNMHTLFRQLREILDGYPTDPWEDGE
jgi:hypothetical protein